MPREILLRNVAADDLPIFFAQQLDPDANRMAAFTSEAPADREAFMAKWARIQRDESVTIKTVVCDAKVAGSVLVYTDEELGKPEVSYWLGRDYWGQGVATKALSAFLAQVGARPLLARFAKDNIASIRVLEKCGFRVSGKGKGFSNAR